MKNKHDAKQELLEQIDMLKREMVKIASKKGLNDIETLKHSQKLDELMNIYQKKHQ